MLPASSNNEPDRDSSGRRNLRRWGPIGRVVTVALVVGGILLFDHGLQHEEAEPQAEKYLKGDTIDIFVSLGTAGGHSATLWGCDLSAEYVKINCEYLT